MAAEEYARSYAWGHGHRTSDYELVSPCHHIDLPQHLLEPIPVRYATAHGFKVRFDTQLLSFVEDKGAEKMVCVVQDRISGRQYNIHTRYLFGADGGGSVVVEQLRLPMTVMASWNVRVKADLSHIMQFREGNLHCILRLEKDCTYMDVGRMVKPWDD